MRKENGGVNFAFCFSTKIRFKKENGRFPKVKKHEVNVFLSTSKQSPEKNCKFYKTDLSSSQFIVNFLTRK